MQDLLQKHYEDLASKSFFSRLIEYSTSITSSPSTPQCRIDATK